MFNIEQKRADKVARAIAEGRYSLAEEMLRAGARTNGVDSRKSERPTSLMLAIKHKQVDLVRLLIEEGADVNARDVDGDGVFHYLAPKDLETNLEMIDLLVDAGANINATNSRGYTAFRSHLGNYERAGAIAALLRKGVSTDMGYSYYGPAIVDAARRNEPEVLRELVRHGASLASTGRQGYTALHMAASEGNGDVVKALIELGADTQARDEKMNTPADIAQEEKHFGIANYIRQQAGMGARLKTGWVKVSNDEVALVSDKKAVGYRLTEIFNFATQEATLIARNLESGNESVTVRSFGACNDDVLVLATQQLQQQGGNVREIPGQKPVRLLEKRS